MQKNWIVVLSAAVLMGLVLSGCASATQPPAAAPVEVQPQQPAPVQVQPTQEAQAPEPAAQTFAPVCQTGASGCSAPVVADVAANDGYCVKKIRYHNVLIPQGTTFETIDSTGDFKCFDQHQVEDGKSIISCTGEQLMTYQLKLTNSSCGGSNLQTGTGQCQEGYGFDSTNQCCAALGSGTGGSTTIAVNIGACPGPQSN